MGSVRWPPSVSAIHFTSGKVLDISLLCTCSGLSDSCAGVVGLQSQTNHPKKLATQYIYITVWYTDIFTRHVHFQWRDSTYVYMYVQIPKHVPMHVRRKMKDKPPPTYFEVDPPAGTIPAGQKTNIRIRFMPTEEVHFLVVAAFRDVII